jgi:hypothetical protein
MLCRPGYKKILDDRTVFSNHGEELWDIKDGEAVQCLKGPDGKPFLDGFKRSELHLVWSLSIDWFNSFHNKQAGKKASAGSIAMLLLTLPPSLQYKPENIYLHAVMPKEPTGDWVNNYLGLVVEMLENNYQHSSHFTKTYDNPHDGWSTQSMITVEVFDLKGEKRVTPLSIPIIIFALSVLHPRQISVTSTGSTGNRANVKTCSQLLHNGRTPLL